VVVDKDGGFTDVPIKAGDGADDKVARPAGGQDPDTPVAAPKPKPSTPKPETPKPPSPTTTQQPPPPPAEEDRPEPPAVPPSPPGAPTVVNATAGDASATVSWGPAPDNRSAITGYRIAWAGGQTTVPAGARTSVIPGLANGTTYVFTVSATNGVGAGPGTGSNPVTPTAPVRAPSEPTNLVVDYNPDTRTAVMSWDPPADLGGGTLAHYIISVTDRSDATVNGETATITDIGSTGTITFAVRAVTTAPGGQQLVGARASTSEEVTPPAPAGTVTLTRGPETQEWCAGDPDCAWMHVVLTGMRPNTTYRLMPHSTAPTYSNPGGNVTTDANGYGVTDQFAYHVEGDTVWVIATDPNDVETRSNDLVWEKAT